MSGDRTREHDDSCNCVGCQVSRPYIRDGEQPAAPTRRSSLSRVRANAAYVAARASRDAWVGDRSSRVLDADPDTPTADAPARPDFSPANMERLREAALQNYIDTADAPADTDLRVDMREAIYYCLTDASMWIGDDGQPLDYLPAREALMGEFLDEAVDALLPLVRARISDATDRWLIYASDLESKLTEVRAQVEAARGETRQP